MSDDLRLIEDYLPIEAISKEASREKSVRKGHISTLHLWWARRPLVACRAAVYGALVPADRWVQEINVENGAGKDVDAFKSRTKKGLNRKHAKEFVTKLCRYPNADPTKPQEIKEKRETEGAVAEAQKHILQAHAERLTKELADAKQTGKAPGWVAEFKFEGDGVTYEDILAGRAPRPRVLDMFAGGGAIPLEALRLGCEAYALDLNPVAHIIELCTLVYPQKYGKPDLSARGMTGPKNAKGETTWGGLADEVGYWGNWVLDKARRDIGDLYPLIADPDFKQLSKKEAKAAAKKGVSGKQLSMSEEEDSVTIGVPPGYLMPVAYLWTRTVRCKNPSCNTAVPLAKQTWLCKKDKRFVALKIKARRDGRVEFIVVESESERGLGFLPTDYNKGGNVVCPACGTVADVQYVRAQGAAQALGLQLMSIACSRKGDDGKVYLEVAQAPTLPEDEEVRLRLERLCDRTGLTVPNEPLPPPGTLGFRVQPYGITKWSMLFSPRQLLCLVSFTAAVRLAEAELRLVGHDDDSVKAVMTYLAAMLDKLADFNSVQCTWNYTGGRGVGHSFTRQTIPMTWDFAETNPFNPAGASWPAFIDDIPAAIARLTHSGLPARVTRGTAMEATLESGSIDAVVTDPPYYDNVPYADISDFFYVWLRRTVGNLYAEHFGTELTPKKNEAIAEPMRHGGDMSKAKGAYESMMSRAFAEAHRLVKADGALTVVYAHKTTLGWSTLVEALRRAGFTVTEAWPLDTEMKGRMRAMDSAALASSITLVARKRSFLAGVGNYEDDVQPDLQQVVRERVETLWEMGIAGADLVIACVGAGLRAFTKYEKVEYANGEEMPAEKFLAEVEGVVLDTMMGKLFGQSGTSVSAIDPASRFYVLWRFVYKIGEIDAGEAIVFTYAQHVELDGPRGLSDGRDGLVEKKKAKYRARDFSERGKHEKLGLPDDAGQPAPLIDVLHRILWLMENAPRKLSQFLDEAQPNRERLRVLAQALAGAALSGKSEAEAEKLVTTTPAEQAALGKLLANWRSLIESHLAAGDGGLFGSKK